MASGDFTYNTPTFFNSEEWNNEASEFLWDSPQPEPQSFLSLQDDRGGDQTIEQASMPRVKSEPLETTMAGTGSQKRSAKQNTTGSGHAPAMFSVHSSASESSSHSSSSTSSHRKCKVFSESSPAAFFGAVAPTNVEEPGPGTFKMEKMFSDMDDTFQFEDSTFPVMGAGMDNLSLDAMGGGMSNPQFDLNSAMATPEPMATGMFTDKMDAFSPQNLGHLRNHQSMHGSPQMTIQPSKTFFLSGSREQSPNSAAMMNSQTSSPAAFFNHNSPMSGNEQMGNGYPQGATFDPNSLSYAPISSTSLSNSMSPSISPNQGPGAKWPCRLTVDPTPEKSRVETQIPIRLTLYDVPPGITKIHLPAHTISKPKFQAKPPFVKSEDTLELYTTLVCASALQKEGVEERAFNKAAIDEEGVTDEQLQAIGGDENDPAKPLNGGPVAICQGCIVRERKRAARKKTKKVDEEEEWAKDEAKRVVVFNCAEVRDWCVPGTKETAVQEHEGPLNAMFVHAPMRIACYCRHQSEKLGFQVIFTVKTSVGKILAQAICNSIMITDDHKQPMSHAAAAAAVAALPFANGPPQIPGSGVFTPGQPFGIYPSFPQEMPFRPSWSTNDLRLLGNQYAPQPQQFQRHFAPTTRSAQSTASVTPRNLSRPASPTSPSGHSTKKRRSAGSGTGKVPAGLTMTRIETRSPPTNPAGASSAVAGPSPGFTFNSPTPNNFGSPLEQPYQQQPMRRSSHLQSGPSTPLVPGMMTPNGPFGSPLMDADPYPFFSAPTSQHPSRAPSPNPNRMSGTFQGQHVPQQAAFALASLPPGLNLQRPPIIQRLIPNLGPRSGGDEVTILGSGFFQGLDVMFGDIPATNTTFWGDTTLVCRAPPSATSGAVAVVFKHQHHTAPRVIQEVQALHPHRLVAYSYYDDDKTQMQGLALGISSQHQGMNGGQMSQEDLARNFFPTQPRMPKFSRTNSSSRTSQRSHAFDESPEVMDDVDFEASLMDWLNDLDMADSPFEPRFNLRDAKGSTLLILAAGRGYNRFVAGLLARGVNPGLRDRSGFTALMMASLRGYHQIARRLLLKGADPEVRSLRGQTAADIATSSKVLDILSQVDFLSLCMQKTKKAKSIYRRPSSTISAASLSGLSSSSQPSNALENSSTSSRATSPDTQPTNLENTWSPTDLKLPSATCTDWHALQDHPTLLHASTALLAWREHIAGQIQAMMELMQSLHICGNLQMPALGMPDYRRFAEMIMAPSSALAPPAYSDIYPASGVEKRAAETLRGVAKMMCAENGEAVTTSTAASTAAVVTLSTTTKSRNLLRRALARFALLPWCYLHILLFLGLVLGCATSGFAGFAASKAQTPADGFRPLTSMEVAA